MDKLYLKIISDTIDCKMYEENNVHAFVSEHIDNTSKMFEIADSISECDNMWTVMAWYFFLF